MDAPGKGILKVVSVLIYYFWSHRNGFQSESHCSSVHDIGLGGLALSSPQWYLALISSVSGAWSLGIIGLKKSGIRHKPCSLLLRESCPLCYRHSLA